MKLQTKFGIFWGLIVFLGITGFSALMYKNTTDKAIQHAQEKAEIVLAEIEAIQDYFKEVVRPKMYNLIPEDEFMVELMSTSHVAREITKRFNQMINDVLDLSKIEAGKMELHCEEFSLANALDNILSD